MRPDPLPLHLHHRGVCDTHCRPPAPALPQSAPPPGPAASPLPRASLPPAPRSPPDASIPRSKSLLPPLVEPLRILPARRLDPRLLRQTPPEAPILLAGITPHDSPHRSVCRRRGAVDPQRPTRKNPRLLQPPQHPHGHLAVSLRRNPLPGFRQHRMLRTPIGQRQPQETPPAQRVRKTPGDLTLGIAPLEAPHQKQPEANAPAPDPDDPSTAPWNGAQTLSTCSSKAGPIQDLVQPLRGRIALAAQQCRGRCPRCLSLFRATMSHAITRHDGQSQDWQQLTEGTSSTGC